MVKGNDKCKGSTTRLCCFDGRWMCHEDLSVPCPSRYEDEFNGKTIYCCSSVSPNYYAPQREKEATKT